MADVRGRVLRLAAAAVVLAGVFVAAGCSQGAEDAAREASRAVEEGLGGLTTSAEETAEGGGSSSGTLSAPDASAALTDLRAIPQAPERDLSGYDRDDFDHWAPDPEAFGWEAPPDGSCDVRDSALIRDGEGVTVDSECEITSGRWVGPYSGEMVSDPSQVEIDHVVALAEAYGSGAYSWDSSTKESYANSPGVVAASESSTNQEKSDDDPAEWMPAENRCAYAARWVSIKSEWGLSADEAEKRALSEVLQGCV